MRAIGYTQKGSRETVDILALYKTLGGSVDNL